MLSSQSMSLRARSCGQEVKARGSEALELELPFDEVGSGRGLCGAIHC